MLHTRVYFSRMCYQIAPRVLHFSAFISYGIRCSVLAQECPRIDGVRRWLTLLCIIIGIAVGGPAV